MLAGAPLLKHNVIIPTYWDDVGLSQAWRIAGRTYTLEPLNKMMRLRLHLKEPAAVTFVGTRGTYLYLWVGSIEEAEHARRQEVSAEVLTRSDLRLAVARETRYYTSKVE